ncbi:hypothetical protein AVEN_61385-1 [Araneus ventricosus]|uniref:Uncharacterized protein n=1 Tax=Araneus ventricosus TaxID=182803 RepID=A0A4Y2V800_ARAVE|nr:hypothetical protein AVEN_61385-1 [Araneus ventricosus]
MSFRKFRPRFALFPVFGTGRINVVCGLVSASVVSRVVAVNSSHIKEARRRHCIRSLKHCRDICKVKRRRKGTSTDHSQQMRTSSGSKFGQGT